MSRDERRSSAPRVLVTRILILSLLETKSLVDSSFTWNNYPWRIDKLNSSYTEKKKKRKKRKHVQTQV